MNAACQRVWDENWLERLPPDDGARVVFALLAGEIERLQAALGEIEQFGHRGGGHGCGYSCADIAQRALVGAAYSGR